MTADNHGMTWIKRLREAAGSGELIDMAPGLTGREAGPPDGKDETSVRQLPAEDIRAVLLDPSLVVDPRGLQIRGALVSGTLDLDHAKLPCRLVFTHCRFENAPSFVQTSLPELIITDAVLPRLSLRSAQVAGDCRLAGLCSSGVVDARGIRVGGELDLTEAKLSNPGGRSLMLSGAEITGDASFKRLEAAGQVRALGAKFNAQLILTGAKLTTPNGTALGLDGAKISGGAFLNELEATGEVRALGANFDAPLVLTGAKLSNPNGNALSLDTAKISGGVFLSELEATGEVRATGVDIDGQLVLTGAKLTNPNGNALSLDTAKISGDVFLHKLDAVGTVRAIGADMDGLLGLLAVKLTNANRNALDLSGAALGRVLLDDAFTIEGRINLSFVSIRVLSVGAKKPTQGLPPLSGANGWTVGTVHGFLRTDCSSARDWLDTVDRRPSAGGRKEFVAQPWKELAKIYDQIGQPEDGRRLRYWAARRTTQVAPWTSKVVRWPYAALVGYGYYPALILGWLAALWACALVLCCLNAGAFTPTEFRAATITVVTQGQSEQVRVTGATAAPPNYPNFNAGLFALDTAIPAASTGQATAWRITENTWLPLILAGIKGFAWVLAALLLAGITGLLRKD
jgi:uncharacterized protein YjbI with pentapeptide repeats